MEQQPFVIIRNYRRKSKSRKSSTSTAIQKEVKEFIHQNKIRQRKLTIGDITHNIIEEQIFQDEKPPKSQGFKQDDIDQYFSFYDNKNNNGWIEEQNFQMEKIEQQPVKQNEEGQSIKKQNIECELQFEQFKSQDFRIKRFD